MNKSVSIGIVVALIVIGILVVFSLGSSSFLKPDNLASELNSGNEGGETENEAKPPGRNLSIEFDEKMGLSTP